MAMNYLLAAPGRQKFIVFLADDRPSIHIGDYIQQLLANFCGESANSDSPIKKYHIHLLLFAFDKHIFTYSHDISTVYDAMNEHGSLLDLDEVYKNLIENLKKKPNVPTNVLILDDFSVFSLLSSSRDCTKLASFLKKVSNKFQKIYIFAHKLTLSSLETSVLYDIASAVAILGCCSGSSNQSQKSFVCDLLKIKPERRVSHEQSKFQVINGEVVEHMDDDPGRIFTRNQEDILKNLTTFKLTLEENEKESRSKLYLPYFDAQKITVEDPQNFDDFEDEEDEEV